MLGPDNTAADRASPSGSLSLTSTPGAATSNAMSSSTPLESSTAIGVSLTGFTVNVTVAASLPPFPSDAV